MRKALLAAAAWLIAGAAASADPVANTTEGPVQGTTDGVVNSFRGIRYAAPPVGSLRWAATAAPPSHQGVTVPATQYGAYCPQGLSQLGLPGGQEDCLFLNVQTPASAAPGANLPVMVWIHGGGLTTGSGQEYDGAALVRENNVVFVSFNYRLGLLGFLALQDLAALDQHGSTGDYGLLDQQAAIAWVRANATNFGGNPNSILIFGESAGGQSVIDQLAAPARLGHIRGAVIESGAYARVYPTKAEAEATGLQTAAALGCPNNAQLLACLAAIPAQTLVSAVGNGVEGISGGIAITPNVDGYALPMAPFQAFYKGAFARAPVIDGTNHDEYRLFVSENDLLGTGPFTANEYFSLVYNLAGGSFGQQVLATYPVSAYPSPNYAVASVATDYAFSCGAVLADALLSKYVPVYSYELNDPNLPNIFLPPDPYMPSLGDPHAGELPYLFPAFRNEFLNLGPANFSPAQLVLTRTMRANWAALARYGRPISPGGGIWPRYSLTTHAKYSLVAPSPSTYTGFLADHKCDFWLPFLLQQAGLPAGVPY